MPGNLLEKLKRLEKSVAYSEPLQPADEVVHDSPMQDNLIAPFFDAGFEQISTPHGFCWRRKTSFDLLTQHGKMSFYDATKTDFSYYQKFVSQSVDMSHFRYYDVETNGLGTGAGTFPFLHTMGYFEDDELIFVQYFLDDYDAEAAVLWALQEFHLPDDAIIVTYNGKSFDWPLQQNRRVMHQMKRLDRAQLDLLHLSRRLWRKQLQNLRLSSIEKYVLGVSRTDDVPGSEAPERYMKYLEQGDVSLVEPVLSHNLMDVCSLVTLQVEIARHLNGDATALTADIHLALARWYDVWHDVQAADSYRAAYQAEDADWLEHWLYSLFLKRRQNYEAASYVWTQMVEKYPLEVEPLIELAKYYEHRQKNFTAAQAVVVSALARRRQHQLCRGPDDDTLHALEHRLSRIRSKQAKFE